MRNIFNFLRSINGIGTFVFQMLLCLLSTGLTVATTNEIGMMINSFGEPSEEFGMDVWNLSLLILTNTTILFVFAGYVSVNTCNYVRRCQAKSAEVLMNTTLEEISGVRSGATITKVIGNVGNVKPLFGQQLMWFTKLFAMIIFTAVIFIQKSPLLMVLCFFPIIITLFLQIYLSDRIRLIDLRIQEMKVHIIEQMRDIIKNIMLIKSYSSESYFKNNVQTNTERLCHTERASIPIWTLLYGVGFAFSIIPMITLLFVGGDYVASELLNIGDLVALCLLLSVITQLLMDFSFVLGDVQVSGSRIHELMEVWDIPRENQIGTHSEGLSEVIIEFRECMFTYANASTRALSHITLQINRGDFIAVIGESGSGKSTLLKIMSALIESDCLFWGRLSGEWDMRDLRRRIAYVPQDSVIFSGTLLENLTLGDDLILMSDIDKVIDGLGLRELINSLPNGYKSLVDGNRLDFSGGERQRLSIARALLKKSRIIIMDEPTSGLDKYTENDVMTLIKNITREHNVAVVLTVHKLELVTKCDLILVMKDGVIVERGTHNDLIRLEGYYSVLSHAEGAPV